MGLFKKKSKEEKFWDWFVKNEDMIFNFTDDQERVFAELRKAIDNYEDDLSYELSTVKDGKREFIISAEGIQDLFPAISSLVEHAPKLDRWEIIPFRPRMANYDRFVLDFRDKSFDPKHIWFYSQVEDGFFDLLLFHLDYTEEEEDDYVAASYLLLDTALGEYDVTMNVRYIDHKRLPDDYDEYDIRPYSELRGVFDHYLEEWDG